MQILFADKFPANYLSAVESLGHVYVVEPSLDGAALLGRIGEFDALVVRSTEVSARTIAAADSLKLVIRAGAGTNTIDKSAAAARGIRVCNVPGKNAAAVAELALGLMLSIDRNIPDNVADLRAGIWNKSRYSKSRGLYGQTLGIVGLGSIGVAVAERARAFGVTVLAIAKDGRSAELVSKLNDIGVEFVADLVEMAAKADILSFHVPGSADTKHLVDQSLLEQMKVGAMLINTSRGDVVDELALVEAMDKKGIRAGIDVYVGEPVGGSGEFQSALAQHPNVYGTHHIGASTAQAQDAVAGGVVEILKAFADGTVLHCVNW